MKINLQALLEGKGINIKENTYFDTKAYLQPFISRMESLGTERFISFAKESDQLPIDNGQSVPMYTRVLLQAVLNEQVMNLHKCICMTYALDTKIPLVKFYSGWVDNEDRFYSFGTDHIIINKIESEEALDYSCIDNLLKMNDLTLEVLDQNKNIKYRSNEIIPRLGNWCANVLTACYVSDYGAVKLTKTLPLEVYADFFLNKRSEYYQSNTDEWRLVKILQRFLDTIRDDDKDIINKAEKTFVVNKILGL